MVSITQVSEAPVRRSHEELEAAGIIPRDHLQRPLIWLPDGSKRVPYARPSGLGEILEDKEALMSWGERMVLDGIWRDPGVIEAYEEIVRDPDFNPREQPFRGEIQKLTRGAKQIANAMSKADIGSQLHEITEAIDLGKDPGWIPPDFEPLVDAYVEAMEIAKERHGLIVLHTEQFVVNDEWKVAGTYDKLLEYKDKIVIGDSKTTGTLAYGKGKFAIQLKAYAMGWQYYPQFRKDDTRRPIHRLGVDQDLGIIIHFPSDGRMCSIVEVPLTNAQHGFELTRQVREWRNSWKRKSADLKIIASVEK